MKHKFFQLTAKSFAEQGVATYKELWEKAQAEGYTAFQLGLQTVFTKADGADNKFHIVISDALEDRHGDIVKQSWVLKNYNKNPVLLDSHNYSSLEYIIGKLSGLKVKDDMLQGDAEFALSNPRGMLGYNLAAGGYLNAVSAGFIPLEFGEKGEILRSELLEVSMVSVPANPRSLIEKTNTKTKDEDGGAQTPPTPIAPEIEPEPQAPEPETKKKSKLVMISEKMAKKDATLKQIAKELTKATPENINERKRRIMKALRQAL